MSPAFGDSRLPARFWSKVQVAESGCWMWTAAISCGGYGAFAGEGRRISLAHRWSYQNLIGEIPADLQLDHLCRVRGCVNPSHLEPVSSRENTLRGEGLAAKRAAQTHCLNGHEFTEATTYVNRNGTRQCRPCATESKRRSRAAKVPA